MQLIDPPDNATITLPYVLRYSLPQVPLTNTYILHLSDSKTFVSVREIDQFGQYTVESGLFPSSVQPNATMKWQLQIAQILPDDVPNAYESKIASGSSYYSRTLTITNP